MSIVFDILKRTLLPMRECDPTIDAGLAVTSGVTPEFILSSLHDIVKFICRTIETAEVEILLSTSYWEGKSLSAFMIARSCRQVLVRHPRVIIRIIVDNGTKENIGKKNNIREISRENWKQELGIDHRTLPSCDMRVKSIHVPLLGTMHAKYVVVDRKIVVLSSNNVQDRPNAELAVSMIGEVCNSFVDIFYTSWNEDGTHSERKFFATTSDVVNRSSQLQYLSYPMMIVNRKAYGGIASDVMTPQNCAWWTMMSLASRDIVICTPTFNAKHAIEAVYLACRRGVTVTLILTKNFNDKKEALPFQNGTNLLVIRKLVRRLKRRRCSRSLIVRWYVGRHERRPRRGVHSHVKFLSIDDEIIMFGNGNMDTQSWYHSMEVNVVTHDPNLAIVLREVATKHSVVANDVERI